MSEQDYTNDLDELGSHDLIRDDGDEDEADEDQEDIESADLDGDGIPDDLEVDDLDELVDATPPDDVDVIFDDDEAPAESEA